MLANIFLFALTLAPFATAHGKVAVVRGNAGGNGTALGIQGGIVPGAGPNSKVRPPIPERPLILCSPTNPHVATTDRS